MNNHRHLSIWTFAWNNCRIRSMIIRRCKFALQCVIFLQKIHHQQRISMRNSGWQVFVPNSMIAEISVRGCEGMICWNFSLEELSRSVWVKTLMNSFFKTSAAVFVCSWNVSSRRIWLIRWTWTNGVLMLGSQWVWLLNSGENNLKNERGNDGSWLLKKFFSLSFGVSFRAWRALLRTTRSAAIQKCLLNSEDLAVLLSIAGDEIYVTMRQIWEVYV